ncbi:MAG: sulfite exporter TauE/SafE family protein [Planctomycetes bacterium]|nr:sulfite exporter TauE/SafE family protein [Planctomycetota bacterium]
MNALDLAPFAVLGLVGSLHCAGMCGPLAASLGLGRARSSYMLVLAYVVGKAAMYSVLALIVARTAAELGAREAHWLALARAALAWLAGLVMVLVALSSLGWLGFVGRPTFAVLERALRSAMHATRELPGPLRGFALGAANGLLPCGLSWSAIALGAASGVALAALGPFVFGLATGLVLGGLALGASAVPESWRRRGRLGAAALLLGYGAWTVWRGVAALG